MIHLWVWLSLIPCRLGRHHNIAIKDSTLTSYWQCYRCGERQTVSRG